MDIYELIDYYIDKYLEEKEHQTDGYALAGMLQGLLWICRFGGVTDENLGDDRLVKISGKCGYGLFRSKRTCFGDITKNKFYGRE